MLAAEGAQRVCSAVSNSAESWIQTKQMGNQCKEFRDDARGQETT